MKETVLYLVSWDDAGIVKFGSTDRRRWRSFRNDAQLVLALSFCCAPDCYTLEGDLHYLAGRAWPSAFNDWLEAEPYLGRGGGGWRECYRTTPDEVLDLIAFGCHDGLSRHDKPSQCGVTMRRHTVTSHPRVTLPRHGRTDGRTDIRTENRVSVSAKTFGLYARAHGQIFGGEGR